MRRAGVLAVVLLVLAGCLGGPDGPEADSDPTGEAGGTVAPRGPSTASTPPASATSSGPASTTGSSASPSPAPAPPPAAGTTLHTLDVGGRSRTYLLHVPPGLAAGEQVPFLVMLHPAMTSGSQVQYFYGLDGQADAHRFIIAYPDGTPESDPTQHTWNAGYCCGAGRDTGSQDEAFISALLDHLLASLPIDPGHVGVAGHSNGGMLAHRVASSRGDVVSSLMVVAGSIGGQRDRFQAIQRAPTPVAPLDVLILHAADDAVIAYEGGNPPGPFEPARIDLPVHQAVDHWLAANGLSGEPVTSAAGVVRRESWTGGAQGTEVLFITTEGGHGWPGVQGGQPPFFRTPAEPAATPLVAEFFLAHAR